jgi:chromosome segregation protein
VIQRSPPVKIRVPAVTAAKARAGHHCHLPPKGRKTLPEQRKVTPHAVTMARMDRLFGVTMGEQGVSQPVSVVLKRAEALVA